MRSLLDQAWVGDERLMDVDRYRQLDGLGNFLFVVAGVDVGRNRLLVKVKEQGEHHG